MGRRIRPWLESIQNRVTVKQLKEKTKNSPAAFLGTIFQKPVLGEHPKPRDIEGIQGVQGNGI